MKTQLTRQDYNRINGCSGWFNIPHFEFEEVIEFLENLGYKIIVHETNVKIREVTHDGGEVRETGKTWDDKRPGILAIKPNQILPDRLDSEEGKSMGLSVVFNKEIKKKLLSI